MSFSPSKQLLSIFFTLGKCIRYLKIISSSTILMRKMCIQLFRTKCVFWVVFYSVDLSSCKNFSCTCHCIWDLLLWNTVSASSGPLSPLKRFRSYTRGHMFTPLSKRGKVGHAPTWLWTSSRSRDKAGGPAGSVGAACELHCGARSEPSVRVPGRRAHTSPHAAGTHVG